MADSTYNNVPEPRGRWLALAGLFAAVAGVFTFIASRTRRVTQPPVPAGTAKLSLPLPTATPSPQPLPDPQPAPVTPSSPWRTLAFLAFTVILGVTFIVLQNNAANLSVPLFLGLIIGAVLLAIANAPAHVRALLRTPIVAAYTLYAETVERLNPIIAFLVRHRLLFSALSTLVAFTFMIQSTLAFQLVREEKQSPNKAIALLLYGIIAVGVALFCARPNIALPTRTAIVTHRANRWLTGAGIAVLLLLSEVNGKALKLDFLLPVTTDQQFILLVIGLILLALGWGGVGVAKTDVVTASEVEPPAVMLLPIRSRIIHYSLLALILLVAFFARFFQLNDIMRFLIDEESFILATHYLRAVPNMEILTPFSSIAAFPYLFPYWQMHTINLFGANLLGVRGTSAILGAFGVAAIYLLARTLFDRKTALLAALFLATFPPHMQFSRIGISEIASPLFGTLAFAFFARGLLHGRRMDYALAGIMLGLTHYFHEGGRLLYTPLAVAWVAASLIVAPRTSLQSWVQNTKLKTRSLLVAVIALVLTAAPIYYTLVATGRPLFARMVDNSSGLNGAYWRELIETKEFDDHVENHVLPAFLVYVNQLDNTFFYSDKNAFVLPLLVPFFLFGIAYAIWRWRAPGMLLLLLWPLSTSIGNSLMVDSAGSPRYVMVFPVLALVVAVGLSYSVPLILRHRTRIAYGIISVAAVGMALFQLNYYFNDHMVNYNEVFRAAKASPDGYDAALRSLDFPRGTTIHIISLWAVNQIEAAGLLHLSRPDLYLDTVASADFTDKYIDQMRCRVDHAFFIERDDFETLDKLREKFYLREPQFTPYDDFLPAHRLVLFYAPYMRGSEAIYGRRC
jgi:4-amino-4-deoxy-L-arabinose transferase-like glycosyltransferase